METLFIVIIIAVVVVAGIIAFIIDTSEAHQIDGRRAALKEAIEMVRERADAAVYLAPEGKLQEGVMRAQVAHNIELELRAMLLAVK